MQGDMGAVAGSAASLWPGVPDYGPAGPGGGPRMTTPRIDVFAKLAEGLGNPITNGDGAHFDYGKNGEVVFLTTDIGLAAEMRRVRFRALDWTREQAQRTQLKRRWVIVVYSGKVAFTAADSAAGHVLKNYHPDRVGTLELGEMGFDGKPEEFVAWWSNALEHEYYQDGVDFVGQAEEQAQWRRKPPPGDHGVDSDKNNVDPDYVSLSDDELGIIGAGSVKETPIEWLWKYRFAEGEMALLAGDGGLGKSSLLLAIASLITTGGQWPDGAGPAPLGDVIIVSAEDSRETTLKPRLIALGANLDRIKFVTAKMTIRNPGQPPMVNLVSLQNHGYWKEVLKRVAGCKLLIVDPVPSYLGRGVNDSKNAELRSVLEPFIDEVTRPAGVCFTANTHLNKNTDAKTPLHRITGSMAYGCFHATFTSSYATGRSLSVGCSFRVSATSPLTTYPRWLTRWSRQSSPARTATSRRHTPPLRPGRSRSIFRRLWPGSVASGALLERRRRRLHCGCSIIFGR